MRKRGAPLAVLLGLLGCGAGETEDGRGTKVFDALPDLELWGYLRTEPTGLATDVVPGPIGFDSIRQSTDRTHALIHVSGFT
jgi:hypothetical protein